MYATREQRENIYWRMRETVREFPELRDMDWGVVSCFEDKGFSDRTNIYVATMTTSTISNAPWKATRFWEDLDEVTPTLQSVTQSKELEKEVKKEIEIQREIEKNTKIEAELDKIERDWEDV